jgi:hypothetical protein
MARNAYSKMHNTMTSELKMEFYKLFFTPGTGKWEENNPITKATGVKGKDKVIPNEYLNSDEKKIKDPTTLELWIAEIINKGEKSDALSPPEGWKGGGYGMGLLDVDKDSIPGTSLMLLEYRATDNRSDMGEISGKSIPLFEWFSFAEQEFKKAKVYDSSLELSHYDRKLKMDAHKARSFDFWKGTDLNK